MNKPRPFQSYNSRADLIWVPLTFVEEGGLFYSVPLCKPQTKRTLGTSTGSPLETVKSRK
jgi:hypothetical protein